MYASVNYTDRIITFIAVLSTEYKSVHFIHKVHFIE